MKESAGEKEVIKRALVEWYNCMLSVLPDSSVNTATPWRAAHSKTLRSTFEQDLSRINTTNAAENVTIARRNLELFEAVEFECTLCKDEKAYMQFIDEARDYLVTWCHNVDDGVADKLDKGKK
jgi:hypothetical protein